MNIARPLLGLLTFLTLSICSVMADQVVIIPGSTSSQGIAIANILEQDPNGPLWNNFAFYDVKKHHSVGNLFEDQNYSRHAAIIINWSASGKRVATITYYGTKMGRIDIFERQGDGSFKRLPFHYPDPHDFYQAKYNQSFLGNSAGHDQHSLGPWKGNDSIKIISGLFSESENSVNPYFALSFEAHISNGQVQVSAIKPIGPLTESESESLFEKIGSRYNQAPKGEYPSDGQ